MKITRPLKQPKSFFRTMTFNASIAVSSFSDYLTKFVKKGIVQTTSAKTDFFRAVFFPKFETLCLEDDLQNVVVGGQGPQKGGELRFENRDTLIFTQRQKCLVILPTNISVGISWIGGLT